jgi:AcrR family transcriptional regulator
MTFMNVSPRTLRTDADQRRKRDAIVEAAMRVFADAGVAGTSVRAIAERAGYTPGALYTYFEDKDALVDACLANSLGRVLAALRRADDASKTGDALGICANAFRDYYRTNPAEFVLLLSRCRDRPGAAAGARAVNGRLIALLTWIESRRRAADAETDGGAEAVTVFAQLCGLVLAEEAGWLAMLGFDGAALIARALRRS